MRTDGMDTLRTALKAFGSNDVVSGLQLAAALGLETESQKQVMRRRLHGLVQQGEAERVGHGQYRYKAGAEPRKQGESYGRMWRIIRTEPSGWTIARIAMLARIERTMVDRYTRWLLDEGFVEKCGRNGNTILWRTTAKGREQRDTPWPPVDLPDPYAAERQATASLCQIL
ncbi:MAG: hypothetical protein RRY29_10870, partial [Desulfovibrionaceae bacterium]